MGSRRVRPAIAPERLLTGHLGADLLRPTVPVNAHSLVPDHHAWPKRTAMWSLGPLTKIPDARLPWSGTGRGADRRHPAYIMTGVSSPPVSTQHAVFKNQF